MPYLGTMKRPDQSGDSLFIPKNMRSKEKRERLDLPTGFRNVKRSFEVGISCIDSANRWQLEDVKEVVNHAIQEFISHFQKDIGMRKDYEIEAYEKAAKDRASVLSIMMHKLQTAEPGDIMVYVYGGCNVVEIPDIRYLKKGSELLFLRNGDEYVEILEFEKDPKIYSILFKSMIQILANHYLPIKVSQPKKALVVLQIAQFLITAGNIYSAFRSPECLINEREKEAYHELKLESTDLPASFLEELKELQQDIKGNKLNYIREFNRAISSVTSNSIQFRDSDYYSSIKKSASYSELYGRLPATLASAYEIDMIKDISEDYDKLTGYSSNYLKYSATSYTLVGKTLTIDQNKIKRRVIHIFSNAVQDRMNLIERLLSGVTGKLLSDCTRNQNLGVQAATIWTSRSYREERDNPTIGCMDLSNATDNLNKDFQEFSLSLVLPSTLVSWWMKVVSLPKEFQFRGFKPLNYDQVKGQPQGLLSSFTAFSIAHHIVMLLTMKRAGLEDKLGSQVYRILGDDSIINSVVGGINGNLIVKHYTDIARLVGWDINLSKSHITYFEDEYAFAEFAKVTILDGVVITPPPFRLLSQVVGKADRGAREFAFCIWLAKHGYADTLVLDSCMSRWAEGERLYVLQNLIKGGIIPFLDEFQDHTLLDDNDVWKITAIEYLRSVIKESIIDSVLNDREMNSLDYMETYVRKVSVSAGKCKDLSEIALLNKLTEDLPSDHKLWYFLQRNSHIEDAVKSITGLDHSKTVISSLELTEDEIDGILSVESLIQLRNAGVLTIDRSSLREILGKLKGLERYRLKSMYKSIGRMSNTMLIIVDNYFKSLQPSII